MRLFFLTGPTAVGKTELALRWAQVNHAEILSCDSTLVYPGMDIGTAKPTHEEQALVPHHGIDCADLCTPFTIKDYLELALRTVKAVEAKGKKLLITGGSGFYLKTFFSAVVDDLQVPDTLRKELEDMMQEAGLPALLSVLKEKSPQGLGSLDIHNPRRVLKTLERVWVTGKSVPELEADWAKAQSPFAHYPKSLCLLERDKDELARRIRMRAVTMLEAGLIQEVEFLKSKGLCQNPTARSAIGYRETLAYLAGEVCSTDALLELIIQNTLHYVKKQKTFFRHQLPIDRRLHLDKAPKHEINSYELFPISCT